MSCRHSWHDCGSWGGPPAPGWYEPGGRYERVGWHEDAGMPIRRRSRPTRRLAHGTSIAGLTARFAQLQQEIGRIEAEMEDLRGAEVEGP